MSKDQLQSRSPGTLVRIESLRERKLDGIAYLSQSTTSLHDKKALAESDNEVDDGVKVSLHEWPANVANALIVFFGALAGIVQVIFNWYLIVSYASFKVCLDNVNLL